MMKLRWATRYSFGFELQREMGVRNDVHQRISNHCHTPSSLVGEMETMEGSVEASQPATGERECPILRGLCGAAARGG